MDKKQTFTTITLLDFFFFFIETVKLIFIYKTHIILQWQNLEDIFNTLFFYFDNYFITRYIMQYNS